MGTLGGVCGDWMVAGAGEGHAQGLERAVRSTPPQAAVASCSAGSWEGGASQSLLILPPATFSLLKEVEKEAVVAVRGASPQLWEPCGRLGYAPQVSGLGLGLAPGLGRCCFCLPQWPCRCVLPSCAAAGLGKGSPGMLRVAIVIGSVKGPGTAQP